MPVYYFAYGSNLCRDQFDERCPAAKPVSRATLPDYELVFRGVADIVEAEGSRVEGAVYRITAACERALDRYEGFPNLYVKRTARVLIGLGYRKRMAEVMFYVMRNRALAAPNSYYLQTIEDGYADWNIPIETLAAAVQSAEREEIERRANSLRDGNAEPVVRRRSRAVQGKPAHRGLVA